MRFWRTLLVIVVALLATATPASAHVRLIASNPEPGQALDAPPSAIRLTFDDALKVQPIVTVTDPNGTEWAMGQPRMDSKVVHVPADARQGPAGKYKVQYRVTGMDDHLIVGEIQFDITTAFGQPQGVTDDTVSPSAESTSDSGGGGTWWIWVAGALAVLVIVALEVRRKRRDKSAL